MTTKPGEVAAILLGDHLHLLRELWSGFVKSGLVQHIAVFSGVDDLLDAVKTEAHSVELDIRLMFFLVAGPDDLGTPVDIKRHRTLSRVPLIAFREENAEITATDIQTLYERKVSSAIRLPLRFQELGQLVLQLDRYWSQGGLPKCLMRLPEENLFVPRSP